MARYISNIRTAIKDICQDIHWLGNASAHRRTVSSGCSVHFSAVLAPGWQAGARQRGACLSALPPASTQQQLDHLFCCSICISRKP